MKIDHITNRIANALEVACGLDVTPNALEAIQEALDCYSVPTKEHELEVWRQAYNAAIACDSDAPVTWKACADMALADYRAKREEMGR